MKTRLTQIGWYIIIHSVIILLALTGYLIYSIRSGTDGEKIFFGMCAILIAVGCGPIAVYFCLALILAAFYGLLQNMFKDK